MKNLLCLIGIHRHEPIKRIRRIAIVHQSGRIKEYWRGYDVHTCTRCRHKQHEITPLTDAMLKPKADRWLKQQQSR